MDNYIYTTWSACAFERDGVFVYNYFCFVSYDQDTKRYVAFCPDMMMSGYGKTPESARASLSGLLKVFFSDVACRGAWTLDEMFNELIQKKRGFRFELDNPDQRSLVDERWRKHAQQIVPFLDVLSVQTCIHACTASPRTLARHATETFTLSPSVPLHMLIGKAEVDTVSIELKSSKE